MNKHFRFLLLAMIAVLLAAYPSYAGTIIYDFGAGANIPYNISIQAAGAARNTTFDGSGATLRIVPGTVQSNSFLNLSFSNLKLANGTTIRVCANNGANEVGNYAVSGNLAGINIPTNAWGWSAGENMVVSTNLCSSTPADMNLTLQMQVITSQTLASVSYQVMSTGGVVYDSGSVNVANYVTEYSVNFVPSNATIDYISTGINGKKFFGPSNTASAENAINLVKAAVNYGATTGGAGLTVSALVNLQDSASWLGVSNIAIKTGTCSAGTLVATNNAALSGNVALNVSSAFNGTAIAPLTVCVNVPGNTVLSTRTIKASVDVDISSGGNDMSATDYTTVQTWLVNGYQGVIPYISASSTYKTICMINNSGSSAANVTMDVVSSESGASLTGLTGLSIGSIVAYSTMRVDFDSSITPYTYSGGTESAGTATSLTGLQSTDRYSAKITVTTTPASVTVNCIQVDPAGSKRAVPVLTMPTTWGVYWQ